MTVHADQFLLIAVGTDGDANHLAMSPALHEMWMTSGAALAGYDFDGSGHPTIPGFHVWGGSIEITEDEMGEAWRWKGSYRPAVFGDFERLDFPLPTPPSDELVRLAAERNSAIAEVSHLVDRLNAVHEERDELAQEYLRSQATLSAVLSLCVKRLAPAATRATEPHEERWVAVDVYGVNGSWHATEADAMEAVLRVAKEKVKDKQEEVVL